MKLFMLFMIALLQVNLSSAAEYRIGIIGTETMDPTLVTHIVLVGSGDKEDSNQFFQSGLSRAMKYREVFPGHQVVIMGSPEVRNREDAQVFADFKVKVVKMESEVLTQEKLVKELTAFTRIQSLDYFGHSSPWSLKLGKEGAAFDPTSIPNKIKKLKPNFLPNAYITLNSCNSGFYIAPALSNYLEIPVSGTLTSGLFERLESDGLWYKEDDWTKGNYTDINKVSFASDFDCNTTGACVRMKPSRYNYSSYWGNFKEGGLSFSKFFCNYKADSEISCLKGMALSLITLPSVRPVNLQSTPSEFKEVVLDWLCQTSSNKEFFNKCVNGINAAILKGDLVYKSHTGNELNCDFNSCHAEVVCKDKVFGSGPRKGSCRLETTTVENPTNVTTEYLNFMKGLEYLQK